jgi:glutathione S-transferase
MPIEDDRLNTQTEKSNKDARGYTRIKKSAYCNREKPMSDADGKRILWGVGTSRTLRAHWALHELDLTYDCRPIQPRTGETQTAEFTALNARQKIPLLDDNGFVITESAAIVTYLSDVYGQPHNRLLPETSRERARCLEWCFFVISELDATSLYVMRRHGDLRHIYGEAPRANEAAAAYFQKQMRTVEQALADGRPHVLGDRFTAADLLLSTCVTWAVRYGVPVADRVIAWNEGILAREAPRRAMQSNQPPRAIATPAGS